MLNKKVRHLCTRCSNSVKHNGTGLLFLYIPIVPRLWTHKRVQSPRTVNYHNWPDVVQGTPIIYSTPQTDCSFSIRILFFLHWRNKKVDATITFRKPVATANCVFRLARSTAVYGKRMMHRATPRSCQPIPWETHGRRWTGITPAWLLF